MIIYILDFTLQNLVYNSLEWRGV